MKRLSSSAVGQRYRYEYLLKASDLNTTNHSIQPVPGGSRLRTYHHTTVGCLISRRVSRFLPGPEVDTASSLIGFRPDIPPAVPPRVTAEVCQSPTRHTPPARCHFLAGVALEPTRAGLFSAGRQSYLVIGASGGSVGSRRSSEAV